MGRYSDRIKLLREPLSYWANMAGLEFAADIHRLMKARGISQAQLASRLGTSEAYVSKVLRGNANFTLKTMIKLARALEAVLHVHVAEEGIAVRWNAEMSETPQRLRLRIDAKAPPQIQTVWESFAGDEKVIQSRSTAPTLATL
jgi:transcriptional regulator with XRE-family HTH domain